MTISRPRVRCISALQLWGDYWGGGSEGSNCAACFEVRTVRARPTATLDANARGSSGYRVATTYLGPSLRPRTLEDLLIGRAHLDERVERRARLLDLAGVRLERHLLPCQEIVLVPALPLNRVRAGQLEVVRLHLPGRVGDVDIDVHV